MVSTCPTCATPFDEAGGCITCAAKGEGLVLLARNGYAQIREVMTLLEGQGLSAEMEKVPPATKEEAHHPKWNLYVPEAEVAAAGTFLKQDWARLLGDGDAAEAAARGAAPVDLDAGGEVACPACGHRFTISAAQPDCPECGLSLGAGGESVPGETEGGRA